MNYGHIKIKPVSGVVGRKIPAGMPESRATQEQLPSEAPSDVTESKSPSGIMKKPTAPNDLDDYAFQY